MNTGAGLVILAVIFAVGVIVLGLLLITVLPGTVLIERRVDALRRERAAVRATAPPEDETG